MKALLYGLAFLMLVVVISQASEAAGVLYAENCGFYATNATNSTLQCTDLAEIRCSVRDTNGGIPPVEATNVVFTVSGKQYSAKLVSGNGTNGTWAVNVSARGLGGVSELTFERVTYSNSIGTTCTFLPTPTSPIVSTATCYGSSNGNLTIAADCPCSSAIVQGNVVGQPNTCYTTTTPSLGCVDQTVNTAYRNCDWCNPNWVEEYTACTVDREGNNPFLGTTTKKYSGNVTCCALTGLAEDCVPPVDADVNVPCVMDYSATGGIDSLGTSAAQLKGGLILDPVRYSSVVQAARLYSGGPVIRPLVFDVDGNGITDVIVFETVGGYARMKLYDDNTLTSVKTTYNLVTNNGPVEWKGQPSLFGFGAYGIGKFAWDPAVQNGSVGIGVAAVVHDVVANQDIFGTWRWEGGNFTWKGGFALTQQNNPDGIGVNCFVDDCYFTDSNQRVYKANAPYTSHTSYNMAAQMTVPVNNYTMDSLPILMVHNESLGPQSMAVEGFQSSGGSHTATLIVCNIGISSCEDYVLTGVGPGKMTRLVAGEDQPGGIAPVYFATSEITNTPNVYDKGRVWSVKVAQNLSVVSSANRVLSATGGTFMSVSDPAAATCVGGGKGIAIVSHWDSGGTEYNEYACYTMS